MTNSRQLSVATFERKPESSLMLKWSPRSAADKITQKESTEKNGEKVGEGGDVVVEFG